MWRVLLERQLTLAGVVVPESYLDGLPSYGFLDGLRPPAFGFWIFLSWALSLLWSSCLDGALPKGLSPNRVT